MRSIQECDSIEFQVQTEIMNGTEFTVYLQKLLLDNSTVINSYRLESVSVLSDKILSVE